jgi:hypothetical protein
LSITGHYNHGIFYFFRHPRHFLRMDVEP